MGGSQPPLRNPKQNSHTRGRPKAYQDIHMSSPHAPKNNSTKACCRRRANVCKHRWAPWGLERSQNSMLQHCSLLRAFGVRGPHKTTCSSTAPGHGGAERSQNNMLQHCSLLQAPASRSAHKTTCSSTASGPLGPDRSQSNMLQHCYLLRAPGAWSPHKKTRSSTAPCSEPLGPGALSGFPGPGALTRQHAPALLPAPGPQGPERSPGPWGLERSQNSMLQH